MACGTCRLKEKKNDRSKSSHPSNDDPTPNRTGTSHGILFFSLYLSWACNIHQWVCNRYFVRVIYVLFKISTHDSSCQRSILIHTIGCGIWMKCAPDECIFMFIQYHAQHYFPVILRRTRERKWHL
jgi:hypothetical protein